MNYRTDDKLIKKMFRGILLITIMSIVSAVSCVMIDSIVTGQFLGVDAVTAAGLVNPVIMTCNLIGDLSGMGIGVVCATYMGMARRDRANEVFSIVMISTFIVGALMSLTLFFFAPSIAQALGGATGSETIVSMMADYLRGFSFGLIPMRYVVTLVGVMMLDNDRNRGTMSMASMLVADIVFDLLNVLVFKGGMMGMALATSFSNVVGFIVIMLHFRKKDRILHFTFKNLKISDMKDVFLRGIPSGISMGSQALRTLCYNMILGGIAGTGAIASITVGTGALQIVLSICVAFFISTSTLSSLLFGEEDRNGLVKGLTTAVKTTLIVFACITLAVEIFAGPLAGLFIRTGDEVIMRQCTDFIRFMMAQYFLMILSFPVGGSYQGTGHLAQNYILDILREAVFPIASVAAFAFTFGISGVRFAFPVAGILTLITCLIIPMIINKKFPVKAKDFLILPQGFGAKPENLFEASVKSAEDVMNASHMVREICKNKGLDSKISNMLSLFVEEMGINIVEHGFTDSEEGSADLRIVFHEDSYVIRIRDDGKPFDPVDWYKKNESDDPAVGLGIRMVTGMAKDVSYVRAMEMNNLIIKL